jgi:hypothetical protein
MAGRSRSNGLAQPVRPRSHAATYARLFGFCRRSRFASATSSGFCSGWLLRPSHFPSSLRLRSRAPRNLATVMALSNSAIAPSTWRTSLAVGVSSRNQVCLSAAIRSMPRPRNTAWPNSCTMGSRAKRLAVSTMSVRTQLPWMRSSTDAVSNCC